jgi:Zn-dependent protease
MFKKKEIVLILATIVIFTFLINLSTDLIGGWKTILFSLLAFAIAILGNIFAKKIAAYYFDSEIEMQLWYTRKHPLFKRRFPQKPFPAGVILPLLTKIIFLPFNFFFWMTSIVFDIKPRIYRGARRQGLYTFSEITEYQIGLIAASGIIINLIFAIIGYFLGFPLFSRLNIYFAFFNMIPISELDGNKILFGSRILWSFLSSLILIGMLFAILII